MQIVDRKIEAVHMYENNPRKNETAVNAVAKSIKQFGFKQPIIIDGAGVIIAGHTRYKAAIQLGLDSVPCIVADDLTCEQVKAFRLADNKTGELADWDFERLEEELQQLAGGEIDMTEFGFGEFEIEAIVNNLSPDLYDESEIQEYASHELEYLQKKRVIITYTDESEEQVKELLHCDHLKILYTIEELLDEAN